MTDAFKLKLNSAGVRALLKSNEMKAICEEHAKAIADRAGSGYSYDSRFMGSRAIASAYTETFDAMRDSNANNTLLKAMK